VAAGKLTAAASDSLTSWAEALDLLADARARWEEAGRPAVTDGSMGQEAQHPLARAVERAQRHEAQLGAALERILRRIPKDDGMPRGAVPVDGRPGVVRSPDGVDYHKGTTGNWVPTLQESFAEKGLSIKIEPGRFVRSPPIEHDEETGATWPPDDAYLEEWSEQQGVPAEPVLAWAQEMRDFETRMLRAGCGLDDAEIQASRRWAEDTAREFAAEVAARRQAGSNTGGG